MEETENLASLLSVNLAVVRQNPFKETERTGIDKQPVDIAVDVRAPGSRAHGQGSGLVGDYIGDRRNHGGDDQAVYAYALEDLQWWADELGATLSAGQFGENFTTDGVDVSGALIGERWRVGDEVELQVTCPRIPCATFRGWMNRPGWLKTFVTAARPGAYLRVVTPGPVRAGDPLVVTDRPDHDVTVAMVFRALTTKPALLPRLLDAVDLPDETRRMALEGRTFSIG
ncbi:MAG: MOSC domain-containing protein [Actinomycetes bacterium]